MGIRRTREIPKRSLQRMLLRGSPSSQEPWKYLGVRGLRGKKALKSPRSRGNSFFQAGKYYEAEVAYTEGMDVLGDTREGRLVLAVLYSNRGAARLMLKKPQEALVDSQTAIEFNRKYIKAYQRGAKCLQTLGQFDEAKSLLNKAADMLPASNSQYKTTSEKIAEVEDLVRKLEECKESLALGSWSEDVANATLRKARDLAEVVYVSESVAGVLAVALLRAGCYGELCEHVHRFTKEREVESSEGATTLIWWRGIHVQALWQMKGKSKEATSETNGLLERMSREGVTNLDCPFGSPSKICEVEIREFLEAMEEVSEQEEKGNEEIREGLCRIAVESYTKGDFIPLFHLTNILSSTGQLEAAVVVTSGVEYHGYEEICHRVKEEGSWMFKAISAAKVALLDSKKRKALDAELAGHDRSW
ncbi:hypothetical protein BSKO_10852 [Bryopsis sp. KO-2023]|nr:hypothetical protein BSKO_10852 [Bryopsis sp. KO-2023]